MRAPPRVFHHIETSSRVSPQRQRVGEHKKGIEDPQDEALEDASPLSHPLWGMQILHEVLGLLSFLLVFSAVSSPGRQGAGIGQRSRRREVDR